MIFKKDTQHTSPNSWLSNWADINLTYQNATKRYTCLLSTPVLTFSLAGSVTDWYPFTHHLWAAVGQPHQQFRFLHLPTALPLLLSQSVFPPRPFLPENSCFHVQSKCHLLHEATDSPRPIRCQPQPFLHPSIKALFSRYWNLLVPALHQDYKLGSEVTST